MLIIVATLIGALIGWIGSLVMRTATSEGIAQDILAGLAGALAFALLFGSNSMFDAVIASYLGAVAFLLSLHGIRKAVNRPRATVTVAVNAAQDDQAPREPAKKRTPAIRKPKRKTPGKPRNVDAQQAVLG